MKIGLTTSVIQRGQTGVAQYVFSLLRALAQHREHQFVLFVLKHDLPLFDFVRDRMELITVSERFRSAVRNVLWHQTVLPQLARRHRLHVLHVPSYRRMMWRAPCPRVATVHDLAAFHVARKYDWKRMFYARYVVGHLARRQDGLIAVSRNTAEDMRRFWRIPDSRINVIHHGIDLERFTSDDPSSAKTFCQQRFGLTQPFFLYVARLEHPAKNHLRLLKAFELFKSKTRSPWQLVFAGSDWHGADAIHAAIAASPVRADIRSLGFVSAADLPTLYRAAETTVFPSLHEGFGLPVLEAMASGSPVLCSARGALAEVSGNAALIINPENIAEMSRALEQLSKDDNLRTKLRRAGIEWSRQFDWQQTATQTLAVYSRAINPHLAPAPVHPPESVTMTTFTQRNLPIRSQP